MKRLASFAGALGLLLWIAAPAAGLWWLTRQSDAASTVSEKAVYVPVAPQTQPIVTDVAIVLERQSGLDLVAPATTGLVEKVLIQSGSVLADGTGVAVIGGITRLSWTSEVPFTRTISAGAQGPDVLMLNQALTEMGFAAGGSDTATSATVKGIGQLGDKIGVTDAIEFDPGWIIFTPVDGLVIDEIRLQLAAPAPPAGEVILTTTPTLSSATLAAYSGQDRPTADRSSENSAVSGETEGSDNSDATAAPGAGEPPLVAPEGAVLSIGQSVVSLTADRTHVDPASLPLLNSLVTSEYSIVRGQLSVPALPGQWSVPPASVVIERDGATCAFVRRDGAEVSIPLHIIGGTYAATVVEGELRPDDEVRIATPASNRSCA